MSPCPADDNPTRKTTVAVVDDDDSVRFSLDNLLRSIGYLVQVYASPRAFLDSDDAQTANCLILDVRMPELSGFDLQAELAKANIEIPIVFMTGYGDVPMSVRAMKAGAVDFLPKPFRDQDMLDAVAAAVKSDLQRRDSGAAVAETARRYAQLTAREREVMALATAGMMNKQIAYELGLSEITIKIHRGKVMRKMDARTFADLVRLAGELGLDRPPAQD
ncbi:response regulator transcription factor [Pseudooceanicola spongiae]|uniref:Response regulator n=1 Tax=Pseudooceanicola spongiae TaxID=2613965 RepID=A0A7L9WKS0_9RHOB|nr:response regulator [Pseudooceanicola spongiae]QOL79650.1 response regulator [Pseudooceanicola spongiae]